MNPEEADLESGIGPGLSRTPPPQHLELENDEVAPLSPEPRSPAKRRKTVATSKGSDAVAGTPTSPGEVSNDKRASFFLPLFGRKHHHQSSSENLPSKAASTKEKDKEKQEKEKPEKEKESSKPQKEKSAPGDASQASFSIYNFFSRFFHSSKATTAPLSSPQEKEEGEGEPELVVTRSSDVDIANTATTTANDESIPEDAQEEGNIEDDELGPIEFAAGRAVSEEADERQSSQQSLLTLLEEFRSGNMRALSDESLEMLRDMHRQQLELQRLHVRLHEIQMRNPTESSPELDAEFDRLNDVLLKGLHTSMENFSAAG